MAVLCKDAKSCKSWTRVGDENSPIRLYFVIAFKNSLIAAISISFSSDRVELRVSLGTTVSVTRGADVAVTWTLCER
jgi:hypothetical protein